MDTDFVFKTHKLWKIYIFFCYTYFHYLLKILKHHLLCIKYLICRTTLFTHTKKDFLQRTNVTTSNGVSLPRTCLSVCKYCSIISLSQRY